MLRFKSSELLPVLKEAQSYNCKVVFVSEHGVYFVTEIAESDIEGQWTQPAYAIGCNPRIDAFEKWWKIAATELGDEDLRERIDLTTPVLSAVLAGAGDLLITAHNAHLALQVAPPPLSSRN